MRTYKPSVLALHLNHKPCLVHFSVCRSENTYAYQTWFFSVFLALFLTSLTNERSQERNQEGKKKIYTKRNGAKAY